MDIAERSNGTTRWRRLCAFRRAASPPIRRHPPVLRPPALPSRPREPPREAVIGEADRATGRTGVSAAHPRLWDLPDIGRTPSAPRRARRRLTATVVRCCNRTIGPVTRPAPTVRPALRRSSDPTAEAVPHCFRPREPGGGAPWHGPPPGTHRPAPPPGPLRSSAPVSRSARQELGGSLQERPRMQATGPCPGFPHTRGDGERASAPAPPERSDGPIPGGATRPSSRRDRLRVRRAPAPWARRAPRRPPRKPEGIRRDAIRASSRRRPATATGLPSRERHP